MRRPAVLLLSLWLAPAAAQDRPPEPPPPIEPIRPPYYSCVARTADPIGTVEAIEFISPTGVRRDGPTFSWDRQPDPRGIRLSAAWGAEGPTDNSFVQIQYAGADPGDVYRIQVRRFGRDDDDDLRLESSLRRPVDGALTIFANWGPLNGVLSGAIEPRILVLGAEGDVVRSDPIDPAAFGRAVAVAAGLRPELETMVADYRNRCEFVESLGIVY